MRQLLDMIASQASEQEYAIAIVRSDRRFAEVCEIMADLRGVDPEDHRDREKYSATKDKLVRFGELIGALENDYDVPADVIQHVALSLARQKDN